MSDHQPEPVKPEAEQVLMEKVTALAALAAKSWKDYAAGDIPSGELGKQVEWTEADLIEAWREYVHTLRES
jgi:hypothetical protein